MVQISYQHIKTYLAMRNCGISLESSQSGGQQSGKDGEAVNDASNLSEPPLETGHMESHPEAVISTKTTTEKCDSVKIDEVVVVPSGPVNGCQVHKLPLATEGEFTSKRQKVSEAEEVNPIKLKATESCVVEWLKNLDEGVSEDLFMFLI